MSPKENKTSLKPATNVETEFKIPIRTCWCKILHKNTEHHKRIVSISTLEWCIPKLMISKLSAPFWNFFPPLQGLKWSGCRLHMPLQKWPEIAGGSGDLGPSETSGLLKTFLWWLQSDLVSIGSLLVTIFSVLTVFTNISTLRFYTYKHS